MEKLCTWFDMKLDYSLGFTKRCPVEQSETQINGSSVDTVKGVLNRNVCFGARG